jgi:transposase
VTTGFGVELSASEQQPSQPLPSTSLCEAFRDAIELGLSQGRNAMAIAQDLVSESGFRGGYKTVKRFVRKLRGHQPLQAHAVIITAPGED